MKASRPSDAPFTQPPPEPLDKETLQHLAFNVEQDLAKAIALAKLTAKGLGDSMEMFDAKYAILGVTHLLEHIYEHAYTLSIELPELPRGRGGQS